MRLWQWAILGFVWMIVGIILHFTAIPLNTDLYSLSFLLLTGGVCGLVTSLCYAIVDVSKRGKFLWTPFMHVGMNAISIYVLAESDFVKWFLGWFYWEEPKQSLENIFFPTGVYWGDGDDDVPTRPHENVSVLLWTLATIAIWMIVARIMFNYGLFIVI